MGKRKLGALEKIDADLANLQYKIRKDPSLYREEFLRQHEQYEALRDIFEAAPTSDSNSSLVTFRDLVDFVAHVADCYPDLTTAFFGDLSDIFTVHHVELEPELREKIVGSLVLLRKKDLVDSERLLLTLFPILISTKSKSLRAILFQKIISELRSANVKSHNHRLNRTFQTVLVQLVTADRSSPQAIWAVRLTRELWRRRAWTDSRTVEIMKEASLADNQKVTSGGVRFFLGADQEEEESSGDDSDEEIDVGRLKYQAGVAKKTKKKKRNFEKALATVKKKQRSKNKLPVLNFSALHMLHDPQGFAEQLFARHLQSSKSKLNLVHKALVLQLLSRLIGLHKLTHLHLYSYFLKYLTPRQPSVTSFLASLAQATHSLVPPDVLEPLVQKIADEFVSEAVAAEVASAGLNAIREICVRQPLAMTDVLLQDLVQYRKSKDKSVMMAAKAMLGLYREVAPEMLHKRDRGKDAAMGMRSGERKENRFGEAEAGGIEGLHLLEKWKEEEREKKREEVGLAGAGDGGEDGRDAEPEYDDEADSAEWEVDDQADSDDSGGWIDAESDVDVAADDSDESDDERLAKRAKRDVDSAGSVEAAEEGATGDDATHKVSTLATTKILTPADLAKLQELKMQASIDKLMGGSKRRDRGQQRMPRPHDPEAPLTATDISHAALSARDKVIFANALDSTKQQQGQNDNTNANTNNNKDKDKDKKDDADTHRKRSKGAMRQARKFEAGKSTTNKEKERRKNFLMTLAKTKGRAKMGGGGGGGSGRGAGSLVQKRKELRAGQQVKMKNAGKKAQRGRMGGKK